MPSFKLTRNHLGQIEQIHTNLKGEDLLSSSMLNKGAAFTHEERLTFDLLGQPPNRIETLEEQTARAYQQYKSQSSKIEKYLYLDALHNQNETLYFKLVSKHLKEMMPIVYTPTVGEAVEKFSAEHRNNRGLILSYPNRDHIEKMLNHYSNDIDLIIVTDGEGVLGIDDQGVGGINICIGKLAVYTLCAGINPHRVLPIQLDVGTNNTKLLNDPFYLGWRHERLTDQSYDDFIDQFVSAVRKKWPNVFLHWEDFGRDNARKNLNRYDQQMCTFNDDMQGTGVVTLSCLLSAMHARDTKLSKQKIVIFGSGTAGTGIADQIVAAMQFEGLSQNEAQSRIFMLGRNGLLMNEMTHLTYFQKPYAKKRDFISNWNLANNDKIDLWDVVNNLHPTILIGCSTCANAFNEKIIKTMAQHTDRPVIFPLSNPTSKAEAIPSDLMQWTKGKALIATGSPFDDIIFDNETFRIAQCNNAFAFPGIGLGILAVKPNRLTHNMLITACETLSQHSPVKQNKNAPLLPDLNRINQISHDIATAVAKQAIQDGVAKETNIEKAIIENSWEAKYYPYQKWG